MSETTTENLEPAKESWLSQFEGYTFIRDIESVVKEGLTVKENDVLIYLAKELILLAKIHEPEALNRVTSAVKIAEEQLEVTQS